jgi:hypothetical protein
MCLCPIEYKSMEVKVSREQVVVIIKCSRCETEEESIIRAVAESKQ